MNKKSNKTKTNSLIVRDYLKSISHLKLLNPIDEQIAIEKIKNNDPSGKEILINGCLRFVVSIALKFDYLTLDLSDIINDGNIGLIKAAERFDPSMEFRFITFAYHHIVGEIMSSGYKHSNLIKTPKSRILAQKKRMRFEQTENEFYLSDSSFTHYETIEKHSYIDFDKIYNHQDLSYKEDQLEFPDEIKSAVKTIIGLLTKREQMIIKAYYGLNEEEKYFTLQEISDQLGLTKEGVRKIKLRALKKLEKFLSIMKLI